MDKPQQKPERPWPASRPLGGLPKFGLLGLFLFPLALLAYLVVLPFFGLFWLIEWLLPLHPAAPPEPDARLEVLEIAASHKRRDYPSAR